MSYADRLGDAINPATVLLGRSEGQPELFLQGSREDAANRMTLPAGHARHLVVARCAAWTPPLASERQVLTFRTRAWLSFAPPTCRMPLGQASGFSQADPGGRGTPRFRHRLIRFRHFIGGSLALASLNLACRDEVPTLPQRCQWPRAWGMLAHPLVLVRLGRPDYNLQYRLPSAKPD